MRIKESEGQNNQLHVNKEWSSKHIMCFSYFLVFTKTIKNVHEYSKWYKQLRWKNGSNKFCTVFDVRSMMDVLSRNVDREN